MIRFTKGLQRLVRSGTRTFIAVALTATAVYLFTSRGEVPDPLFKLLLLVYAFYFTTDVTNRLQEDFLRELRDLFRDFLKELRRCKGC